MCKDKIERLKRRNQYHRDTLEKQRKNVPMSWDEFHNKIIEYANSLDLNFIRLLDAGAGEGRYKEILKSIKNLEYIGVDSGVGSDDWDFSGVINSDLSQMPFVENESIDIVIMIQVLSHIDNLDECIKEISMKMKDNSMIFISTQNMQSLTHVPYDFIRLTPYGIKNIFEKHKIYLQEIGIQLYGDNVSASRQLEYAMVNNILYCDRCGLWVKFFSKIVIFVLRRVNKILSKIDEKRDMPLNPLGYFAVLKKCNCRI